MNEQDLQAQVLDLARLFGWRTAHFRPAWTQKGWRTPMIGDPGFPDLVLVRGDRLVFAELKSDKGKVAPYQRVWLWALGLTGVEVYVWRPACWPDIERTLSYKPVEEKR